MMWQKKGSEKEETWSIPLSMAVPVNQSYGFAPLYWSRSHSWLLDCWIASERVQDRLIQQIQPYLV